MTEHNKTVLVTGGSRGIGAAIVRVLRASGYNVLYTSRNPKGDDEACLQFELNNRVSAQLLGSTLTQRGVSLYAIINNAGICQASLVQDNQNSFQTVWDRIIATNLTGPAFLVNELFRYMHKPGRIINIASQLGRVGRAGYSAYCASKFGLIGLTEVWSRELAHGEIMVNAVCPGWIKTEMTDHDLDRLAIEVGESHDEYRDRLHGTLDQRRFNTPEEVAGIVKFLLSEEASGITGRCIEMAGPSH